MLTTDLLPAVTAAPHVPHAPLLLRVMGDRDTAYDIRVVRRGDRFGKENWLTHSRAEPSIEVYLGLHNSSAPTGDGYFVSRYNLSTILASRAGIALEGARPDWSLTKAAVLAIQAWLVEVLPAAEIGPFVPAGTEWVLASMEDVPILWGFYPSKEATDEHSAPLNQREASTGRVYKPMTWTIYDRLCAARLLRQPLREIDAETWNDKFNDMPPLNWGHGDGVERFFLSELMSSTVGSQFASCGDRFFTRYADTADRSTWITAAEISSYLQSVRA